MTFLFSIEVVVTIFLSFSKEAFIFQNLFLFVVFCGFVDSQSLHFYGVLSSLKFLFKNEQLLMKLEALGLEPRQQQCKLYCRNYF